MKKVKVEQPSIDISQISFSTEKMNLLYPKLQEARIPLSATGISPRTFFHWKENGLIDIQTPTNDENTRSWVRLNLIQFIWLKSVQVMRDFGVPLLTIKEFKEYLFTNLFTELMKDPQKQLAAFGAISGNSKEELDELERKFNFLKEHQNMLTDEMHQFSTNIGLMVAYAFLENDHPMLILAKKGEKFEYCFIIKIIAQIDNIDLGFLDQPHLRIPIKKMIEEYFDEPKNEKSAEIYGLITPEEKRVLDAFRKCDFKEITIKFEDDRKSLVIEVIKDGDIIEQKAKEIRRILGLNDYAEITLKYRNDKHIYFKNKSRIKLTR